MKNEVSSKEKGLQRLEHVKAQSGKCEILRSYCNRRQAKC